MRRLLALVQNYAQRPEPTQRRQTYQALRQSQEHARLLASFLPQLGPLSDAVAGEVLEFYGKLSDLSWEIAWRIPDRSGHGEAPENHEIGIFATWAEPLGQRLDKIIEKVETEAGNSSLNSR